MLAGSFVRGVLRDLWPLSPLWAAMVTNYTLPGAGLVASTMRPTVAG